MSQSPQPSDVPIGPCVIRPITYAEGLPLSRTEQSLTYRDEGLHLGVFVGDDLVAMLTAAGDRCVRIKAMVTAREHRRRGYMSMLLRCVIGLGRPIRASALPPSRALFLKHGFRVTGERQCRKFHLTHVAYP